MRTIPEFCSFYLARNKMFNLCQNIFPVSYIKDVWLYKEGEPCNYVYFVRTGEIKISMKIKMP